MLPDFFLFRAQRRDGPAINPATVLVPALWFYGQAAAYERHVFRRHGLTVHAPGGLSNIVERDDGVSFAVQLWSPHPCRMLVNGVEQRPEVRVNSQAIGLHTPHQYQQADGRLVLFLEKSSAIQLAYPARGR